MVDVHLFTAKDETLLCWRDALFLLDAFLDALDLVCLFDIEFDLCGVSKGEKGVRDVHQRGVRCCVSTMR